MRIVAEEAVPMDRYALPKGSIGGSLIPLGSPYPSQRCRDNCFLFGLD